MSNFKDAWEILVKRSKEDQPEIPKVTPALPIVRWTEVFKDYLHRVLGFRKIPLAYVTHPDVAVPPLGAQQYVTLIMLITLLPRLS